ncbi:hypothetical protein [uncultured Campylobacter sp.]|uniref:hypothetical protein n=1 Tax=uncultured Campylobacter sp. TaxID=218934 RepID=UPI00261FD1A5|nr:hypothetical protein [uncultured Campylobacter sp.]
MDEEFLSRARQSLFNKAEVSEALAKRAMEEARALSKKKAIPKPSLMDLAMFRLKLLLKIEPTQLDQILANEALREAAAIKNDDGSGGIIKSGQRKSELNQI